MIPNRVVAIPEKIAEQARATLKSPQYGHPAHVEVARSYGPCRSCLQTFHEGRDQRILFTYNPFEGLDKYPLPGPIFIHREACQRYEEPVFPTGLSRLPLTLEGYGRGRWLVMSERVLNDEIDAVVNRLFAHPVVEYIHVRNAEAGCFIARIERMT